MESEQSEGVTNGFHLFNHPWQRAYSVRKYILNGRNGTEVLGENRNLFHDVLSVEIDQAFDF